MFVGLKKPSQIRFLRVYIEINEVHTERGKWCETHSSWLCIQKVDRQRKWTRFSLARFRVLKLYSRKHLV